MGSVSETLTLPTRQNEIDRLLDPQQLINYHYARGWQQENLGDNANNQESVWVLTASSGSEFDITLPLHRKTRSFALRMAEILERNT